MQQMMMDDLQRTRPEMCTVSAGIRINLQRTGSLDCNAFPINAIKCRVKVSQGPNRERSQLSQMSLKYVTVNCHMRLESAYRYILQPFSCQNKMRKKVMIKIRNFVQQFYPATILYICQSFNLILTLIVVK